MHLLHKFRSQFGVIHRLQVLELALLLDWSDKGRAVTLWKDLFNQSSDSILVIYGVRVTFHLDKRLLKIFARAYQIALLRE